MCSLLAVMVRCSTYFNMFYNAQSAFDEAYTIHKKSMRNFPDSIVTQPPPEAKTKYDRAIEKALKVLESFPKNKKWHDDVFFLLGRSYFYEEEMSKAVWWFRQLQEEYPQSPFIPESYVYCAEAAIVEDNLAKAEETLKGALDRYPFLDKDQKLSLLLVEVSVRREGRSQAVERLEEVRSSVRSEEKRLELQLRAAELYRDLLQYDRAIALLRKAPRDKKLPALEYRTDRDLVACYAAVDSLQQALTLLGTMQARRRYEPYVKEILFTKGIILERMNRLDEAAAAFRLVVGSADTTRIKADTAQIVGRALLKLGLLYQKRKGDYEKAESYYKLVVGRQVQDTSLTVRANKRLEAMKKMRELRAALAGRDTSATRMARRFKMGELFYYELDEPDSAYRQFVSIVNDTGATDTAVVPRALFAGAYIARRDFRDTARSDSLYRLLAEKFPGSDYCRRAQEEMKNVPVTATRGEKAAAAFRNAEKLYIDGADTKGAVQAYYNVFREYPDLEIAPKSLFAAAWLTDNELGKKKTAKSLYEKICERYPHSVYCIKEAQPKLKVVSDTLESLRRPNRKTGGIIDSAAGKAGGTDTGSARGAAVDSLKQTASKGDSGNASAPRMAPILPPPSPATDSLLRYNPKMDPRARMMMHPPAPGSAEPAPEPVRPDSLHR